MYNIQPDCFILALFKRDDGKRFLLGSGMYEFTEKQLHFAPNTVANDVVELQGADGQLLAGQVLRSARQSFDGVIGDASVTRMDIENARRAFINFFIPRHKYQVIYILPDGRSITRYRGYLVDAPSVQELWQFMPVYHVALAFEQLPYYSYAEDEEGNQIYANQRTLEASSWHVTDGGVEWDAGGAMWMGAPIPTSPNKYNVSIDFTSSYNNLWSIIGEGGKYKFTATQMTSSPTEVFGNSGPTTSGVQIYGNSGDTTGSHYTLTIYYTGNTATGYGYPNRIWFRYLRKEGSSFVAGGAFQTSQNLYSYTAENPYVVHFIGRQGATSAATGTFELVMYNIAIAKNASGTETADGYLYIQFEEGDVATPWQPADMGLGADDDEDDKGLKWTDYASEGDKVINHIEAMPMAYTEDPYIKPSVKLTAGTYQNVVITNQTNNTSYALGSIIVTGEIEFAQSSLLLQAGDNEIVMTADNIVGTVTLEWNDEVLA